MTGVQVTAVWVAAEVDEALGGGCECFGGFGYRTRVGIRGSVEVLEPASATVERGGRDS